MAHGLEGIDGNAIQSSEDSFLLSEPTLFVMEDRVEAADINAK